MFEQNLRSAVASGRRAGNVARSCSMITKVVRRNLILSACSEREDTCGRLHFKDTFDDKERSKTVSRAVFRFSLFQAFLLPNNNIEHKSRELRNLL